MIVDDNSQQLVSQRMQTFPADGYSSESDAASTPIFIKNVVSWKFDTNTRINYLAVSNNVFILHLNEKTLQRRCLDEISKDGKLASNFAEVQMPDAISKIFLDPFGRIVIVSTRDKRDVYVLLSSTNSLKLNKKPIRFSNNAFVLVSVSWCNRFLQQNDVIALLAGQDGSIYEVLIRPDGESSCIEVYPSFKSIMGIHKDGVTGVYCDVMSSYEENSKIFAVITTHKALYYFEHQIDPTRKSDFFSTFFAAFRDASLSDLKYLEFPSGNAQSEIQLFVKKKPGSTQKLQRQFAWITGAGLFYTEIDPGNVQASFLQRNRVIDYYIDKSLKQRDEEKPPRSVALTEFHCLMMFPNENQTRIVCTVNQKIVTSDGSMESGQPVCFARDQIRDQLWGCTDERILRYTIRDERRDVWRLFMQNQDFEKASETCILNDNSYETNRRQRVINSKHADCLFNQKNYIGSAPIYATSDTSFEDVTLKFFSLRNKEPLRVYLQAVLNNHQSETESTQRTILTLWLTDLFLNELDELRPSSSETQIKAKTPSKTNIKSSLTSESNPEVLDENCRKEKFDEIRAKFQCFLRTKEIQTCLREHRSAMYDLLTSHGDLDDLIFFAEHVEDFERVILLYLEREDYTKALKTLAPLTDHTLLYKYSPILIEKLPDKLIDLWKKKYNERFEAKELLPAMITYSRSHPKGKFVLDFLTFCLKRGCMEKSIHNYLLSEYVKFDSTQIMSYLIEQKEDPLLITYDPRYALRLCIDHDLKEESVFLYRLLNMYEEAVDTALQVDVKLAEECASTVRTNDERKKKLWLKIASSVVTEGHDLNQVMEILEDSCNNLLKIEDILPLFPDFETIDQFKKPIIKSLENYNERLSDLRTEMNDASKSIDEIRDDLAKYRTRCVATIDSNATCSLCEQPLMLQSTFYVFACGHHFHGDCLFTYVQHLLKHNGESNNLQSSSSKSALVNERTKESLDKYSKKSAIQRIENAARLQSTIASGIAPESRDMESLQQELDDILASQCALCGEIAIDYLDQPLDAIE